MGIRDADSSVKDSPRKSMITLNIDSQNISTKSNERSEYSFIDLGDFLLVF